MPINYTIESNPSRHPFVRTAGVSTPIGTQPQAFLLPPYTFALLTPESLKHEVVVKLPPHLYVVVMRCPDNSRVTVSSCFKGKGSDGMAWMEQFVWLLDSSTSSIDILLIISPEAVATKVAEGLGQMAALLGAALRITTCTPPTTSNAAVHVCGTTGRTTVLSLAPGTELDSRAAASDTAEVDRVGSWANVMTIQQHADVFRDKITCPLVKFYDGEHFLPRLPILSETARDIVRVQRLIRAALREGTSLVIEEHGWRIGTTSNKKILPDRCEQFTQLIAGIAPVEPWCSVCGLRKTEMSRCTGCGIDTYCSPEHQRLDWPHHKSWCKKNRKSSF